MGFTKSRSQIVGPATVSAPASAIALRVNGGGGGNFAQAIFGQASSVLQIDATNANGSYIEWTSSATAVGFMGSAAALSAGAATDLAVRSQNILFFATGGANNRGNISAAGNWTLSAPGSGVTATIAGVSGTHSIKIADSATNSFNAGFLESPINGQGTPYTAVLSDSGKTLYYSATGAATFTIPANASVAYPTGTCLHFINDATGATNMTIAITTDTLVLSPGGTTGSRTLAQFGRATAKKVTATRWYIWGSGLT